MAASLSHDPLADAIRRLDRFEADITAACDAAEAALQTAIAACHAAIAEINAQRVARGVPPLGE